MTDQSAPATHLEMRWHQATDAEGRDHMEAVWVEVGPTAAAQHAA